jgi:shikimate kinase/nucleoside-diphosphate-sugar epimerase
MQVLVVGCGYIGAPLAKMMKEAGAEVVGVTRSEKSALELSQELGVELRAGDVGDMTWMQSLANEYKFDVVIHCASSSGGGAEAYQRVFVDGVTALTHCFHKAHLIFVSSTSVYCQMNGEIVDETSEASTERETARLLVTAEQIVLKHGGAVARLAGIYGPYRFHSLKKVIRGEATVEVNHVATEGRWVNQIHQEDAISALIQLATQKITGIYNIVDDKPTLQRPMMELLVQLFNAPAVQIVAANTERKRGWSHKSVSNRKMKAVGWQLKYPHFLNAIKKDPYLVHSILATEEIKCSRSQNLILVGLMGCGKTTIGKIMAKNSSWKFLDLDQMIVEKAGCSIVEIFEREGEQGFRDRESQAVRDLLGLKGYVIATGGGVVTKPRNLKILKQMGYVVWLDVSPELLVQRTAHNHDRPLLNDTKNLSQKIKNLYEERWKFYQDLADLRIQTDHLSPKETAYGIHESATLFFQTQNFRS